MIKIINNIIIIVVIVDNMSNISNIDIITPAYCLLPITFCLLPFATNSQLFLLSVTRF